MNNTNMVNLTHNPSINQQNRSNLSNLLPSGSASTGFSGRNSSALQNPSALMLILQLIMRLLDQLQNQPDPQPPEEPVPNPDNPGGENLITGTSGRDNLKGTREDDRILGLAGNDRITGRAGDDFLSGGQGNDRLHGGDGNDSLQGGAGNDSLFGGRGTNKLSGGEGNDNLYTRLGSDVLDGGGGKDTARIRGQLDDYSITTNVTPPGPADGDVGSADGAVFFFTNEKTGQTIEAKNIEQFRFNDKRLSALELLQHAFTTTPPEQPNDDQKLPLTQAQRSAIADRFNVTPPPDSADFITTRFTGVAIDNNNDSKLSVGDVVKLRDTGGIAGIDQIRDHVLTAEDIEAINAQPDSDIEVVKGGGVSVGGTIRDGETIPNDRIVDINGANYTVGFLKQQVNDYAQSSFVPTGAVDAAFGIHQWGTSNSLAAGRAFEKYIATTFPQGEPGLADPNVLKLTQAQQDAIGARFNRKPPPNLADAPTIQYTGQAIDKDGDGQLGVGDIVKLRSRGGFTLPGNQDITRDHVLTTEDIAFIESDRSNPLLDISKGLSNEQRERLRHAINIDSPANSNVSIRSVFDSNSDGKLSVGDAIVLERSFGPTRGIFGPTRDINSGGTVGRDIGISLAFHTLTQNELDRYLQGGDTDSPAKADFEANRKKWQTSRPQNYSFTLGRSGFIGAEARKPINLTVSGNRVTDAKFADGSTGQVPDFNQLSIDDLFNTIGNAIDNNAAEVRVTYNAETGVPESIFIDQDRRLADEEVFLETSNFKDLDNQNNQPVQPLNLTTVQTAAIENV